MSLFTVSFIWQFPAQIVSWIDGDTCTVNREDKPGLFIAGEHVRIMGIDAPELSTEGGKKAKDYAEELVPQATIVTLTVTKQDKYGRLLAKMFLPDGEEFGQLMLASGNAKVYKP